MFEKPLIHVQCNRTDTECEHQINKWCPFPLCFITFCFMWSHLNSRLHSNALWTKVISGDVTISHPYTEPCICNAPHCFSNPFKNVSAPYLLPPSAKLAKRPSQSGTVQVRRKQNKCGYVSKQQLQVASELHKKCPHTLLIIRATSLVEKSPTENHLQVLWMFSVQDTVPGHNWVF